MNNPKQNTTERKALVTIFEDLETAKDAGTALLGSGFDQKQIELVSHYVATEAQEISTPTCHETTTSSMVDSTIEWGAVGAGIGAVASVVTPFPGLALSMIAVGGLTGAIVGGMTGIEHAVMNDSVDLPTVEQYEEEVKRGRSLVVVLGTHEEAVKAKNVIEALPFIHSHTHLLHGHEFHEHPAKAN